MAPPTPYGIPYSVARIYAGDHGHHLPSLLVLLRAMDGVYEEWWADRVRESQKKTEE